MKADRTGKNHNLAPLNWESLGSRVNGNAAVLQVGKMRRCQEPAGE